VRPAEGEGRKGGGEEGGRGESTRVVLDEQNCGFGSVG
jgi:hypothetical protein